MPIWLVVLGVIVIGVGVALVVGVRRPRSLEDELKQPVPAPPVGSAPPGQSSTAPTSDGHAPLAATIQALASRRATGKLLVTSGDRSCSLYFLFGHLFHAESGSFKGEDALQAALAWGQISSQFDPSAHLPSEETLLRPTA